MRSLSQIKSGIIDDVLALRSDVKFTEGDPQYDLIVSAPANEFYRYEVLLEFEDRTRNLTEFTNIINDESFKQTVADVLGYKQDGSAYTIADVNTLISDRLDAYVGDWGISRSSGTKAAGIVRVYLTDSTPVTWDTGTTFSSASGAGYVGVTSVASVTPNFDTGTGLYYVDISIAAAVTGVDGNASANSIRDMTTKFSAFSYCRNLSEVSGGSDEETDLELIARATPVWASRVNGSLGGLEQQATNEDYVYDAAAFDTDDLDIERYLGGVVDVVVEFIADEHELIEETVYWPGQGTASAEQFDFIPKNQPLITSIDPTFFKYLSGGTEEQIDPADADVSISIVTDTSPFARSCRANDKIRLTTPLVIGVGAAEYQRRLKMVYVYNKVVKKLQDVFDDTETRMVGPSVMVKRATSVPIRVIVEPQISFGYDVSSVQAAIQSNIETYFNGGTTDYGKQFARKQLGEEVYHSDLQSVILRTEGVASFDNDTFFVINTLTGSLDDPSVIDADQYATLLDILFTYSTSALANFTGSFS